MAKKEKEKKGQNIFNKTLPKKLKIEEHKPKWGPKRFVSDCKRR
jgi:hypothetical protein